MRAVNLLPKDLQVRKSIREEDPAVVVGSALGVIVMIALGAAFYTAHGKASAQERRLSAARLELAQLSVRKHPTPTPSKPAVPVTPILPPPAVTGQEAAWLTAVKTTLGQRIAWDRVLREVSLVMPDDVTLNSMTMSAPIPTVAAVPGATSAGPSQDFVISGSAFSYDSVARLLSRLDLVPDLSGVTLTNTNAAGVHGVQFSISAAVKGAPAPVATPIVTTPTTDTTTTAATG